MEIKPQNGYLLVRQIETPMVGLIKQPIVDKCWLFGNVLDHDGDGDNGYIDTNVMFLDQAGIRLIMENDEGKREVRYLVKQDSVVGCLNQ